MRISCVICGDLCVPSDEVSAIPCGHTFHSLCIIQWIERSKSCPQCRHKATEKSLVKLYFDSGDDDNAVEDPDTLQHMIQSLKFQIRLKDTEISKFKESNSQLNKQNKGLREECKTIMKQLGDKESTNLALKSQLKFMEQYKGEAEKAKQNASSLRNQLTEFQNIQLILSGTAKDVESMLSSYSDSSESVRSLATFCALLKKELNKSSEDKNRFRDEAAAMRSKVKDLREKCASAVQSLSRTEQVNKLMQEDALSLEKENRSLKKKVDALQKAVISPSGDLKNSVIQRLISESPAPLKLKRSCTTIEDEVFAVTPEVVKKKAAALSSDDEIEYLGMQATPMEIQFDSPSPKENIIEVDRNALAVKTKLSRPRESHNIFAKNKPSLSKLGMSQQSSNSSKSKDDLVGYDGLGGHHKVDEFPKPKMAFMKKKTGVKVITKRGSKQTTLIVFPVDDGVSVKSIAHVSSRFQEAQTAI
ncbi:E3 ubiquitin-protein ligase TRAIP-like isoform X2 [Macrobrachium nipponense]|uniref:E3 ubiquitin-protein ligase TRAIP-like isoform X2 n=1 Tax=Macrobrachium nipponense TaxID=159736 RepID=UPI0030C7E7B0